MTPRTPRRTPPTHREGFSLVEALVALAVFGIAVALLLPSFAYFSRINSAQEDRTGAVRAVEAVIDELRAAASGDDFGPAWPSAPYTEGTTTIDNGFGTFVVRYQYCQEGDSGCLTSSNARNLTATVSKGGRVVYELETVITRFEINND